MVRRAERGFESSLAPQSRSRVTPARPLVTPPCGRFFISPPLATFPEMIAIIGNCSIPFLLGGTADTVASYVAFVATLLLIQVAYAQAAALVSRARRAIRCQLCRAHIHEHKPCEQAL